MTHQSNRLRSVVRSGALRALARRGRASASRKITLTINRFAAGHGGFRGRFGKLFAVGRFAPAIVAERCSKDRIFK
jgi:hypothetical protein